MDFLQNWLYLSSVFLSFHKSVQRGTSYLQIISPDLSVTVFVTSHLQRRWATGRGWARHMQRHAWAGAAGVSVTHTYSLNHSFSRILCLCVCFTYSSMTVFNPRPRSCIEHTRVASAAPCSNYCTVWHCYHHRQMRPPCLASDVSWHIIHYLTLLSGLTLVCVLTF